MRLAKYSAIDHQTLFGTPKAPIWRDDIVIIGRLPDDSAFLVLTKTVHPVLVDCNDPVAEGFIFTYCQAWGLEPTPERIQQVKNDLADKIKEKLAALDAKRIRPLAEGDATYLATLNAQVSALREELRSLLS